MSQSTQFRGVATTTVHDEGELLGVYHQTIVCRKAPDGKVKLNSGGWKTKTTLARMNQFAAEFCDNRFKVIQREGQWYVMFTGKEMGDYGYHWDEANKIPFVDGMIV